MIDTIDQELKERPSHLRRLALPIALAALSAILLLPAASAQAACSVVGSPCVRDDFDTRDYELNTGTDNWATDWAETGESDGPTLGAILVPVTPGELRFQAVFGADETGRSLARNVAIPANANNATLLLSVGYNGTLGSSKSLEVAANSIPFAVIFGSAVPNPGIYGFDLDSVLGAVGGTTITIALTNLDNLDDGPPIDYWYIDYVEVSYDSPLAITLADFYAQQMGDHVQVTWETASELYNQGFNLYRSTLDSAPEMQLNEMLIPSQSPGSAAGFVYTWEDSHELAAGTTYYYWLEDVRLSGATTLHGPVSVTFSEPTAVSLADLQAESRSAQGRLPVAATALILLLPLLAIGATRRQ